MSGKVKYFVILALLSGVAVAQEKPFTIEGNLKGQDGKYVYLDYKGTTYDSALIKNGHFSFSGKLEGPVQATVAIDPNSSYFDKFTQLYIVPGNMQLSLDYDNFSGKAMLKGSPVQDEADILRKQQAPVLEKMKPFGKAVADTKSAYIKAIKEKKDEGTLKTLKDAATAAGDAIEPFQDQLKEIEKEFMDRYPASFVTATILRFRIADMPLREGEERYSKLSAEVKKNSLGKDLHEQLESLRRGSPGAKAHVFTKEELRGEDLSLADYRGRYVLLDFWASWCVPCRKGNPHLRSLYATYKGKGLEIIGISDDDSNHPAWEKAVQEDGIGVWKHVLRGLDMEKRMKGEKNEFDLIEQYGIHTLPTKILIDPEGAIIGRYGGGGENDEAMDRKFTEIFDK